MATARTTRFKPRGKSSPNLFAATVDLLGGRQVFKTVISTRLEAHLVISKGFPASALVSVVRNARNMDASDVFRAVGVSVRTIQRRAGAHSRPLSKEQSGRAWKFAEVLAKATTVFGGQPEAEHWLSTPALALDQHRPVDLLSSPAGVELVEQLLGRLEYGVYT